MNNKQFYRYINDGIKEAVALKNILYFFIEDYMLTMHLIGEQPINLPRKTLDDVERETRNLGFFRCNRSYLVNLCHCSHRVLTRLVIMHTDAKIEISRRKLQEFDKQLILYRMEGMDAF